MCHKLSLPQRNVLVCFYMFYLSIHSFSLLFLFSTSSSSTFCIQLHNVEVLMNDSSKCVFYYLQKLLLSQPKSERLKKIWDETFV